MLLDLTISLAPGNADEHSCRTRILRVAERLMLTGGYTATTVDEICREAGVTKGAFFHHFRSKEEMAEELLKRFVEKSLAPLAFALDSRLERDPLKRLHQMIRATVTIHETAEQEGCLIGMFTQELALGHENFREICAEALSRFQRSIEKELRAARKMHAGDSASRFRPKALAAMLVALVQGTHIFGRATGDASMMKKILAEYQAMIDSAVCA